MTLDPRSRWKSLFNFSSLQCCDRVPRTDTRVENMAGADPSNPSDPSSSSSSPSPSAPRIIRTRRNRDRDRNLASPGPALAGASSELDAIPELAGAASPISHQPDDIRAPAWYTAREGDGDGDGDGEPAPAKNLAQRGLEGLSAFSTLVYPDKYLGYLSTR